MKNKTQLQLFVCLFLVEIFKKEVILVETSMIDYYFENFEYLVYNLILFVYLFVIIFAFFYYEQFLFQYF